MVKGRPSLRRLLGKRVALAEIARDAVAIDCLRQIVPVDGGPAIVQGNSHGGELPPFGWSIDYDSLDQGRTTDVCEEAQARGDHREAA